MDWLLRHRRALAIVGVALAALITATCVAQQLAKGDADVVLFAHAGRLLLTPPNDLYLSPVPPHNNYYYYPPFFAVLSLPLNWLPEWLLLITWAVATVAALAWSLSAFYSGMTASPFFDIDARRRWTVIGIATIFILRPAIDHLRFGQVNIFVLAAAVLALVLIKRRRHTAAGLLLGLAIAVKLLLIPFAALFAIQRRYLVLAGIAISLMAAAALPALFVGIEKDIALHREWLDVVLLGVPGEWTSNGNISIAAQVMRYFAPATAFEYKGVAYHLTLIDLSSQTVAVLKVVVSGLVLLVIGFVAIRFRNARELISKWGVYALVFALVPCFSTITEIPHLVLLAPPAIFVAHAILVEQVGGRVLRWLFGASFVLTTLTSKTFVGEYFGKLCASTGVVILGVVLLAAAVVCSLYALENKTETIAQT